MIEIKLFTVLFRHRHSLGARVRGYLGLLSLEAPYPPKISGGYPQAGEKHVDNFDPSVSPLEVFASGVVNFVTAVPAFVNFVVVGAILYATPVRTENNSVNDVATLIFNQK